VNFQTGDAAVEMFKNIICEDNIQINMEVADEPQSLFEYIDGWRMKIWDHGFLEVFKGADAFKKSDSFRDFKGSTLVVKRTIFRYIYVIE